MPSALHQNNHNLEERLDLFRYVRIILKVGGMYPLELESYFPQQWQKFATLLDTIYVCLVHFTTIHITVLYFCTLYIYYEDGELEFLVNTAMQAAIYIWTVLIKFYFRSLQPLRQKHLLEYINSQHKTRSAMGFTFVSMDDCLKMSNKWFRYFVTSGGGGAMLWLILPMLNGERGLPLACWYPFDYKRPYVYEAMYFLQAFGQMHVWLSFSGSTSLFMVLCIIISGQYDILYCSLKNIVATSHLDCGANREFLVELCQLQLVANDEPQQYFCCKERHASIESLLHFQQLTRQPKSYALSFRKAFKACIQHHLYILRLLAQMEIFWNPIYFWKIGHTMLLLCVTTFVSVKSTTANSPMKVLTLGQYLVLMIWEMLLICYFGEVITNNSMRCGAAILKSPWYLHMREMKSDFLLFLVHSQRSVKLTGGKIFALNIERFQAIITTAFSFFTILQKMDKREVD